MPENEILLKNEIIQVGRRLYETGLAVAKSGNISARLDEKLILITATGTSLGNLSAGDIVKVDLASMRSLDPKNPSSELPLHALVYKNFPAKVVVHCGFVRQAGTRAGLIERRDERFLFQQVAVAAALGDGFQFLRHFKHMLELLPFEILERQNVATHKTAHDSRFPFFVS